MVIDTSAVLALLWNEPDSSRLVAALESDPIRHVSAAALVEASIVVYARHGDYGERELDLLLHRLAIEIASVTAEQADIARAAFRRFGKGRHPAGLNYGDCFSYALAMLLDEPLLFTGNDFAKTDVRSA